jgi:hypothetical protein
VPDRLRFAYVFLLVLNLFIIPEYVLNSRLNTTGEFLNFLTFDLLFYVFTKSIDFNKEE